MLILLGNNLNPHLRDHFNGCVQKDDHITASIGKFVSSEAFSEIIPGSKELKGQPVTIIQSLAATGDHTSNDLAMELLFSIRTLKRNGAGAVWAVMPFMAYGRQDRAFDGRMTSVAIDDFSFLLKQAGATGVSTIEMHSQADINFMEGHFGKKNVFNLDPTELFAQDIENNLKKEDLVVGGPDTGANARADALAQRLSANKFSFTKQHLRVNKTEITGFSGDVSGKTSITVDDMIDTGGTIKNAQIALSDKGAKKRYVYTALPIFSNGGLKKLFTAKSADGKSPAITQLVVADTIDIGDSLADLKRQYGAKEVDKRVRQISTGDMLYNHIMNDIHKNPAMKIKQN